MKVLILNTTDIIGGAARAAYRIHKGLQYQGIDSTMMVQRKASDDFTVIGPLGKKAKVFNQIRPYIDSLPLQFYRKRENTEWCISWMPKNIKEKVFRFTPDIINLQWINGGFLSYFDFKKFNKPIVWTLQDCWAFTGGCSYPYNCNRYQDQCGSCPQLGSKSKYDLSHWVWLQKAKHWRDLPLTVVAISRWVAECARSSSLFKNARIEVIPNGLDTRRFKVISKQQAREILNLPSNQILVLFGSMNVAQKRKGFQLVISALKKLSSSGSQANMGFVIFGASPPNDLTHLNFPTHNIGYLHDDYSLTLLYSACDVIVVPSTQEAFGQTVSESLACGTPAVAFNVGGFPDLIDHQQNGYLAQPFDTEDLAHGITWIVANPERHMALCRAARIKAEQNFSISVVSARYKALFNELLIEP